MDALNGNQGSHPQGHWEASLMLSSHHQGEPVRDTLPCQIQGPSSHTSGLCGHPIL